MPVSVHLDQPVTPKGRATKARILQVAADLILENGVSGTGMEDVRKAAGVSGSQMTHYFHDKRSLVQEVIAWQAQTTLDKHHAPDVGGLDSLESLQTWARLNLEAQEARGFQGGCSFGSLAGQLVESDAATRTDLAEGFRDWLGLFRDGLTAMRNRGDLRRDADPDELAYALLAALQGGMLLSQTLREPEPLRAALAAALARVGSFATRQADRTSSRRTGPAR